MPGLWNCDFTDGVLQFEEGDNGTTSPGTLINARAVEQDLEFRFKTQEGEHPIDPFFGLPFDQLIGVFDPVFVEGEVGEEGEASIFVEEVLSVTSLINDRTGETDITVEARSTDFGNLFLETSI